MYMYSQIVRRRQDKTKCCFFFFLVLTHQRILPILTSTVITRLYPHYCHYSHIPYIYDILLFFFFFFFLLPSVLFYYMSHLVHCNEQLRTQLKLPSLFSAANMYVPLFHSHSLNANRRQRQRFHAHSKTYIILSVKREGLPPT